jgi:hypothetical protein
MRTSVLASIFLATAAVAAAPDAPRVNRSALMAIEKTFDSRIERAIIDNPFLLLGTTRGVYLPGYGAVFTAELNLVTLPAFTPFRPHFTKEELAKVRANKLERLARLKQLMQETMIGAAASLDTVPTNEQIAVGVSLFYNRSWEDTTGLPSQVVMEAPRKTLVDFQARRITSEALEAALRVQEL